MKKSEISLQTAREAFELRSPEEALEILEKLAGVPNGEMIFLKGEIYFKLQKWGESLNYFSLFLEQFPSNKKAESYCIMIQNILGFYNKDLLNP